MFFRENEKWDHFGAPQAIIFVLAALAVGRLFYREIRGNVPLLLAEQIALSFVLIAALIVFERWWRKNKK